MRVYVAVLAVLAALVAVPSAAALDLEDLHLPDAVVGKAYSFQLDGEAGCEQSHKFRHHSGNMPPGLVVSQQGLISGTPTGAGRFDFYVELTDDCNSKPSEGRFDIHVLAPLVLVTEGLKPTLVGRPYTTTLVGSGTDPLVWSVGGGTLPPGMTLKEDGTLTGTPAAVGSFTFTVNVRDLPQLRAATKQFTLVVANSVAATPPASQPSEVGVSFTAKPATTGGAAPFAWSVARGSLPAGLALDRATGTISGTPTVSGSFPIALAVTEAAGTSATVELTLTIAPRLALVTARLARAAVGRAYRARLASRGGVGPVAWKVVRGTLPGGIRLDTKTGAVAGTARKAGTYRVTVTATDRLGARATRALVLTVLR